MQDQPRLTARQQQVLQLIRDTIARDGAPPTRAEIASILGFRSANAAEEHLKALARKGVIELLSGTSRGIRIKSTAQRSLGHDGHSLPLPGMAQLALPLIGRVAAGSPILAQEHVDQTFHVEAHLFEQRPDYLLRVRGWSMQDAGICDGDLLAVRSTRQARSGQIIVARLDHDVTVKRLHQDGQHIRLLAESPDHPDVEIQPGQEFVIEGLAVGLIRSSL